MTKTPILQNAEAVEARFPGYTAVAGPYGVNMQAEASRRNERALCVCSYRDQVKACPKARIVMHGAQAWIIRKLPLIDEASKMIKTFTSGQLGIKAGRGSGPNKKKAPSSRYGAKADLAIKTSCERHNMIANIGNSQSVTSRIGTNHIVQLGLEELS